MSNPIDLQLLTLGEPNWATIINNNLQIIAAHTHNDISGTGFQVNANFIACESDLIFVNTLSTITISQIQSLGFSNLTKNELSRRTLFVKNSELCFSNGIGVTVQITSNGSLNVTGVSANGFTGNLTLNGAHVDFTSASATYHFFGNSSTETSIFCGDVVVTNDNSSNISFTNTVLFENLQITNISPIVDGNYLLLGQTPYTPTLTTVSTALFADSPLLAQHNIAQVFNSLVQRAIQTDYITNMFCFRNTMIFYFPVSTPVYSFLYNSSQYINSNFKYTFAFSTDKTDKGYGLFFGAYDRTGQTKPPYIITGSGVRSSSFFAGNQIDYKVCTPFGWELIQ